MLNLKKSLRAHVGEINISHKPLVPDLQKVFSENISQLFFENSKIKMQKVLSFEGIGFEPLIPKRSGVYLPKCHFLPKPSLEFIKNFNSMEINRYGISEPSSGEVYDMSQSKVEDVIFVPGLAFDHQGCRIGRGKGFYDRFLKDFKGTKVGVCFSFQFLTQDLPVEAHDVKMDYILTEKNLVDFRQRTMRVSA